MLLFSVLAELVDRLEPDPSFCALASPPPDLVLPLAFSVLVNKRCAPVLDLVESPPERVDPVLFFALDPSSERVDPVLPVLF